MENKGTAHDPRHVSRAIALQVLFARLVAQQPEVPVTELLEEMEVTEYDQPLVQKLVDGVFKYFPSIDPVIAKLAPAWPIEQIAPVDLMILRMAVWEGFIGKITPIKVVINEAIELGKQFGGPSSGSFINGVLGSLMNSEELQIEIIPVEEQNINLDETDNQPTIEPITESSDAASSIGTE